MNATVLVSAGCLVDFCNAVLAKAGLGERDASTLTQSLVFADLRGLAAHGVARLPEYLARVDAGVMNLDPPMRIQQETPGSALLDANNGLGQIAGAKAMGIAIAKARANGVALVAVRNSNHFGAAAYFARQACDEDMIGLVTTNAAPSIAPFGAKPALVGTNPLCAAIPAAGGRPILLDMATSVVARGKIWLAGLAGKKIPLGWALDKDGRPTDDPNAAQAGSLEAIGGPKGSGLSLVIDILCGVLTGTTLSGQVRLIADLSAPMKVSHLFMAINIASFVNLEQFKNNVEKVIERVKSLPSVDGSEIFLPGEIEFNLEAKRRAEGIPLSANVVAGLDQLAERYRVPKLLSASARA
jgi:LDH2 family malate/lactate/ureidoglycolate dehydrogenase